MNIYKRPEMELDPAKMPGQIVNRPVYPAQTKNDPDLLYIGEPGLYLRDVIARIQREESCAG